MNLTPRSITRRNRLTAAVLVMSVAITGCADDDQTASELDAVALAASVEADPSPGDDPVLEEGDGAADVVLPTMAYDMVLSRDPFDPVRDPPEEAETVTEAEGGTAAPGVPGGVPVAPEGVPVLQPVPAPVPGGEPACRTYGDVVCNGISILLLDVTTKEGVPVAVIQANTTVLEVTAGTTFFEWFRVLAIDGSCVSFAYGDETFSLCVGDQILK
jgi:hypothetical protein